MDLSVARTFALYALNSLPTVPNAKQRGEILTRLFEDTLLFLGANVLLVLRGHPGYFITGYFTGIVLDRAVQEKFEKIKRVALFTLLLPICFGQEGLSLFAHTATFAIAAKIGSRLSLRHNKEDKGEEVIKENVTFQNIMMLSGAGMMWVLKGHPFLLLAGFLAGAMFEKEAKITFEKVRRVAFGDPLIILAHGWFTGAIYPFIVQANTLLIAAKIGSILSSRFHPKPDGTV